RPGYSPKPRRAAPAPPGGEPAPRPPPPPPAVIPPAPPSVVPSQPPGGKASVVAGLVLSAIGIVIALIVFYMHARDRGGHTKDVNPALSGPLQALTSNPAPVVSLRPQPLEGIPDAGDGDAGAPLAPLTAPSVRHSRRP